MLVAQKQKYKSMEEDRKSRGKPMHLWSPNLWWKRQEYAVEKRQSLQQVVLGKLRYIYMKLEHSLTPYTKVNLKWIKDLNIRLETIKLLEESLWRILFDINHSKVFFDPPSRVMEIKTKINKWDLTELKSFVQQRKQ